MTAGTARRRGVPFVRTKGTKIRLGLRPKTPTRRSPPARKAKATASRSGIRRRLYGAAGAFYVKSVIPIKYLLSLRLSPPPLRRGQGWWFALPRSSAGAIKMRRRHRWSVSVRSTDDASHRSYPALQATKGGSSRGNLPLDPVLLPFAGAKGRPPRRAVLTMPLQKAPRRRQATTYLAKILLFIFPHRKVTPAGQVYRLSPFDDSATPPGDHQPSHKPHSTPFLPRKDDPHA